MMLLVWRGSSDDGGSKWELMAVMRESFWGWVLTALRLQSGTSGTKENFGVDKSFYGGIFGWRGEIRTWWPKVLWASV